MGFPTAPPIGGSYDPSKVDFIVNGVPITGFADGTFIKVTRDNPTWAKRVGNDGLSTRNRNPAKGGKIEITLMASSLSNAFLFGLARADDETGRAAFAAEILDRNSGGGEFAAQAWIEKVPDQEFAAQVSNTVWTIDCTRLEPVLVGIVPTPVG